MKKIQIKKMKEVKKLRKEVIEIEKQQRRNNILITWTPEGVKQNVG